MAVVSLTACLVAAYPAAAAADNTAALAANATLNCAPAGMTPSPCYSPQAYQAAYGVAPLLSHGIDGRGETVVVGPEPAASPSGPTDIRRDLAAFDTRFGLPATSLDVVNIFAKSATPYRTGGEEVTDTEMVHAIAPDAHLDVVLLPPNITSSAASFASAITKVIVEGVALHAAVISISASVGEHFLTRAEVTAMDLALEQARDHHVTVVGSSGDYGAISSHPTSPPVEVSMPASDPLVLAVGGSTLDAARPGGAYSGETAWNSGGDASGGGYSSVFPRPSYQDNVAKARATRGVPDVAANAGSAYPLALAFMHDQFRAATGTSAAAPLWAGVIALVDQEAGRHLGFVNPAIYAIARSSAYHRAFHDVITGDNSVQWNNTFFTGYKAGPGWDPVTGWGSPDAQYLVPLLARTARSGT
jgi:subtilase family serine protease